MNRVPHIFAPHRLPFLLCLFASFVTLLLSISPVFGAEITGPELTIRNNELYVNTALSLDDKNLQDLRNGMKKEFHFFIDLYRVWGMWPDEFISGRQFIQKLQADPVKTEYVATSNDGAISTKKRFKSFESMLQWALNMENIFLANIHNLEPGGYYVRVTIESKIRQLPPVIGYFMIFVKETDFTIQKSSPPFTTGQAK
jgi:hypothetical protein